MGTVHIMVVGQRTIADHSRDIWMAMLERQRERRYFLTLPMLRLLPSKTQGRIDFWKPSKPFHVCINWIALADNSQMSTHRPGFQSFLKVFLHHFVMANLTTGSIRVKTIRIGTISKYTSLARVSRGYSIMMCMNFR